MRSARNAKKLRELLRISLRRARSLSDGEIAKHNGQGQLPPKGGQRRAIKTPVGQKVITRPGGGLAIHVGIQSNIFMFVRQGYVRKRTPFLS